MHVIIKRIGDFTTVADIENFIWPALQGGFLKKTGRIEHVIIQKQKQYGSGQVEYHAIVRIEPDAVARRVIKVLNRKRCNRKPVNVCEYHFRHRDNDRRTGRYESSHDRRFADRRRKNLEITDVTSERKRPKIDYSLLQMINPS